MHEPSLSHSRPLLGLFAGNLKPLSPPDSLHPLGVYPPALGAQHFRDPAITVAAILTDGRGQNRFALPRHPRLALG
jgi:hypothetical protein